MKAHYSYVKVVLTSVIVAVVAAQTCGTALADPRPEDDPMVLKALQSSSVETVAAAAQKLAASGTDAAVRILTARFVELFDPDLRWEIVRATRAVRNPESAEAYYDLLLSKETPALREAAIEVLAAVAPRGVVGRCLDLMARWPDGPVGEAASRVVLSLRTAAAVAELELALRTERHGERVTVLLESLGRIGNSEAVTALANFYWGSAVDMQGRAARAAALVKNPNGLPALETLLTGNTGDLRIAAAQALGNFTDAEARTRIIRYLEKERVEPVRAALEEALRTVDSRVGRKG